MTQTQRKIDVLNNGYIRLVDTLGGDITTVNSARVSMDKATDEMRPQDERLVSFLAKHDHTSPSRHGVMQFEIFAPLMIARQWMKYVVGSVHQDPLFAWNESSRRYITEEPKFYIPAPNEWRSKPENSKQGSGKPIEDYLLADETTFRLTEYVEEGVRLYEKAMEYGICAEQARLFLPAYGLMVRWYWTASVQSVSHVINQRVAPESQYEFQQYGKALHTLASEQFPLSIEALTKGAILSE